MSDIMKGRPMKFRILEILYDGDEIWNYDLVKQLMDEYGMKGDFHRDSVNFDLIETVASGFIESVESEIDTTGKFREGSLLYKYRFTSIGKAQYEELASKVHKKKEA
ncbi:MAG: hypothetical protein WCQ23_05310 [Candidatus Methanomethylophilaceae archaeon]|jgi:hypothetical protein